MSNSVAKQHAKGVSVVICCYNSAARLEPTLTHIANQVVREDLSWEVIVVDNNSNDNTAEVAVTLWAQLASDVAFRVVMEPIPGLMAARMKGIAESKYSYIVFSDDDNSLDKDYVSVVFEIFEGHPNVAIVNGDSYEALPEEFDVPFWWDRYKSGYAVGKQGDLEGIVLKERYYFWGAGISFRISALEKLFNCGFSYSLSGRMGNSLTAGEDGELCMAIRLLGYDLYYTPRLRLNHYIPVKRITLNYLREMHFGFGAAAPIIAIYRKVFENKYVPSFTLLLLYQFYGLFISYLNVIRNSDEEDLKGIESILEYINRKGYILGLIKMGVGDFSSARIKIDELAKKVESL